MVDSVRLKYLFWKEEQKKRAYKARAAARARAERAKWAAQAVKWEHAHPKR